MQNLGVMGVYMVFKGMRSTQVTRDGEEDVQGLRCGTLQCVEVRG